MSEPVTSTSNTAAGTAGGTAGRGGSWRMRKRLGSMILGFQVPVLLFAAVAGRAISLVQAPERASLVFGVGLGIAALALVAAMAMRSPRGVWFGWATQIATFAYAIVTPMMIPVGLIFGGLWIVALRQGRKADALTDAYLAANPDAV